MTTYYQSPICLQKHNSLSFSQNICIDGENMGAVYNKNKKIYEVQDFIELRIGSHKYQLIEYHFHTPSEHIVDDIQHSAEIHYVFIEEDMGVLRQGKECPDVCGCCSSTDISGNILVIGRTIKDDDEIDDLHTINVRVPRKYYMYDGTLTTGDFAPVRWIVGRYPIHMNVSEINKIAKGARDLQSNDGRIVIYSRTN